MANTRTLLAERALLRAQAHELLDVLKEVLTTDYHALDVELWLADYRLTVLEPVIRADDESDRIEDGPAGEAFARARPTTAPDGDRTVLYLPVSVAGERRGVLSVTLDAVDAEITAELTDVATALGQALTLADRVTDEFRLARRSRRLTLAAEIQWQLLPSCEFHGTDVSLAGQLEPAYAVRGDNFDWTADNRHVTVAVTNGMGEGVSAALLTCLTLNALRNARRARLGLADQAALADQAIWAHHGGRQHVETLLLRIDRATGEVDAVDAGSPSLWRVRDRVATRIELDQQLPLGMFDSTVYTEQRFTLAPGDRLFVLSDGVSEAAAEDTAFGKRRLGEMLETTADVTVGEAVRLMLAAVLEFHGPNDLDDDAVAVCVDWHGGARKQPGPRRLE
ncbi:MAG TPA: PP2C family protein-serine/threonine phosphatase [Actinokineospora sp.]|jgi:serine phosphatase RsbU (regulator of sigma subunit)|nr:PP2C family protein-serine/threonine phosphatase [Actinokineospora sp.]